MICYDGVGGQEKHAGIQDQLENTLKRQLSSKSGFRVQRDAARLAGGFRAGVHEKSNNQPVKTQDFSENENQNHSDVEAGLLGSSTNTGVTNNTNSKTSGKTSQTDSETSTQLDETSVQRKLLLKVVGDKDGHDETVDTDDTSHDNGDNVLDDQVGAEDSHAAHTDTGLSSTIGGTEAGENDSGRAAQRTEEGRIDGAELSGHFEGMWARRASLVKNRA